ncbi:MAG: hypothetical protein PHI97_05445 [Desulfobulbus sp.]|nr:hypothetical protein [Desulfobulbus sp.]
MEIIKPFAPTRPQLAKIIILLRELGPELHQTIFSQKVQQSLSRCKDSPLPVPTLIKALTNKSHPPQSPGTQALNQRITALRKAYFGEKASKQDFNATPVSKSKNDELIIQFRLKKGQEQHVLSRLQQILQEDGLFNDPRAGEDFSS